MKNALKDVQKHLMTATSYMILFVVPGGIFYALSIMMNGKAAVPTEGLALQINQIGAAGLALFIPALGGYIAFSIADKAGIGPGFIGAYLAREIGAGFLGGILAGFIAGYTVKALKKIKLPTAYKALGNIFIYPLVGTLVSGGVIVFLLGQPIAAFMNWMTAALNGMSGAAGAVPPIGIGLATILFKKKFSEDERGSGKAAIVMGCMGITEGAIPFATADPVRMIPIYTLGSAIACMSGFLFGAINHVPWGGLIVLPVAEHRLGYFAAVMIGALVVAILTGLLKKDYVPEEPAAIDEDIELSFEDF